MTSETTTARVGEILDRVRKIERTTLYDTAAAAGRAQLYREVAELRGELDRILNGADGDAVKSDPCLPWLLDSHQVRMAPVLAALAAACADAEDAAATDRARVPSVFLGLEGAVGELLDKLADPAPLGSDEASDVLARVDLYDQAEAILFDQRW